MAVAVNRSAKALHTQEGCDWHASWIQGGAEAEAATEKATETNGGTEEDKRTKLKGPEEGGISKHACARRRGKDCSCTSFTEEMHVRNAERERLQTGLYA